MGSPTPQRSLLNLKNLPLRIDNLSSLHANHAPARSFHRDLVDSWPTFNLGVHSLLVSSLVVCKFCFETLFCARCEKRSPVHSFWGVIAFLHWIYSMLRRKCRPPKWTLSMHVKYQTLNIRLELYFSLTLSPLRSFASFCVRPRRLGRGYWNFVTFWASKAPRGDCEAFWGLTL